MLRYLRIMTVRRGWRGGRRTTTMQDSTNVTKSNSAITHLAFFIQLCLIVGLVNGYEV